MLSLLEVFMNSTSLIDIELFWYRLFFTIISIEEKDNSVFLPMWLVDICYFTRDGQAAETMNLHTLTCSLLVGQLYRFMPHNTGSLIRFTQFFFIILC